MSSKDWYASNIKKDNHLSKNVLVGSTTADTLGQETKATLIDTIHAKKSAGFIDATNEFHEALNNTLNIFFAKNSVGRTIAEIDIPVFVNPVMVLVMDGAKKVVSMKLNYELSQETNGAPFLLRNKAKIELFDAVGVEVVGLVAGGVVVKAGSKAFKVVRSFFAKHKFKFSKKGKFKTNGLKVDSLKIKEGRQLMSEIKNSNPNATNDQVYRWAKGMLNSGKNVPTVKTISNQSMYKIVPAGKPVPRHSSYFMDCIQLQKLKTDPNSIPKIMGLPKSSHARKYDIYEIKPKQGKMPKVFESKVADTTEGSLKQGGGGTQMLVPNRNEWTTPVKIETI